MVISCVLSIKRFVSKPRMSFGAHLLANRIGRRSANAKVGDGDKRAIAQLRGWRYQDQRNVRRLEEAIQEGSISYVRMMSADPSDVASWERLANDEVRAIQHIEIIARRMTEMRASVDRHTGEVATCSTA